MDINYINIKDVVLLIILIMLGISNIYLDQATYKILIKIHPELKKKILNPIFIFGAYQMHIWIQTNKNIDNSIINRSRYTLFLYVCFITCVLLL